MFSNQGSYGRPSENGYFFCFWWASFIPIKPKKFWTKERKFCNIGNKKTQPMFTAFQQRMLDKTLLFLSFATGKHLPFNPPLNNNVGDIFGVLELLQYTTSPSLEGNIQIGFVIPIPVRTCAIQSRSPLAFPKILWTKGPSTITRWGSDDFLSTLFQIKRHLIFS